MANEVYMVEGTTIVFGSEGTDDVDWTTESISNGAGRQSAQANLGADPRPDEYRVRFYAQFVATPSLGATLNLYFKTSDSSTLHLDNDDGTGNIAVSAVDKLNNLYYVGSIVIDEATANIEMVYSGVVRLTSQYVHAVMWNASGAATTADVTETKLELTPIYYQTQ